MLLLWLMQDNQLFYQRSLLVKNHYLNAQGELFQQYRRQPITSFCHTTSNQNKLTETFTATETRVALQHYLDCETVSLFRQSIKNAQNSPRREYLNPNYPLLSHQIYTEPVLNNARDPLLWIIDEDTEWQLEHDIYGIVISNAKLRIQGNGRVIGAIISDEPITTAKSVFNSSVVQRIEQQFSRWQVAEGGWRDF
ncbi:DUF2572 family protein [Gallibacterium trehalosifermentans]|uniref:DUF2572 family protein n=1 Tax=Gallibacterium trehalosifermentans TaxID=516935 RepID=UPI0036D36739